MSAPITAREALEQIRRIILGAEIAGARDEDHMGCVRLVIQARELCDAALSAAPAPVETGWQDIATAPKDGTRLIGWDGLRAFTLEARKHWSRYEQLPGGGSRGVETQWLWCEIERDSVMPCEMRVTHYRPLPPRSVHHGGLRRPEFNDGRFVDADASDSSPACR